MRIAARPIAIGPTAADPIGTGPDRIEPDGNHAQLSTTQADRAGIHPEPTPHAIPMKPHRADRDAMTAHRHTDLLTYCAIGVAELLAIGFALLLLMAGRPASAHGCDGPLPEPGAATAPTVEKFALVAGQCDVLAEPADVQRARQLQLYDRGASVTIRMTDPPKAEPPKRPASAPTVVLDRNGKRVLSVAPSLLVAARTHGIDPLLLHAIAHVESRHDASAVSKAGARGVMQVMPDTARRFGVKDAERSLMQSDTNLQASAAYLRTLRQRYGDNLTLVLAAYNAGEGAVEKAGGVPPYPETEAYVRDVTAVYQRLQREFAVTADGRIVARSAGPAPTTVAGRRP